MAQTLSSCAGSGILIYYDFMTLGKLICGKINLERVIIYELSEYLVDAGDNTVCHSFVLACLIIWKICLLFEVMCEWVSFYWKFTLNMVIFFELPQFKSKI